METFLKLLGKVWRPVIGLSVIAALALAIIALERPQVINLSLNLGAPPTEAGNSPSVATPPSLSKRERSYNAVRILVAVGIITAVIIYTLWKIGVAQKLISQVNETERRKRWQKSLATGIATLMIVSLLNYLMPDWVNWQIQLVVVMGIWTTSLLVEADKGKIRSVLAYILGAFLAALVIKNGMRPNGPIRLWWQKELGNQDLGINLFIAGSVLLILGWMFRKSSDPKKQFGWHQGGGVGMALGIGCLLVSIGLARGWFSPAHTVAATRSATSRPLPVIPSSTEVETIGDTGWQTKVVWAPPGQFTAWEYLPGKDFVIQPEGLVRVRPYRQSEYLDGPGIKNPPLTFARSQEAFCQFKAEGTEAVRVKITWKGSWAVEAVNLPTTAIAKPN